MNPVAPSKLSIIVPACNEGGTIQTILQRIAGATLPEGMEKEVILIDDFSTDDTLDQVERFLRSDSRLSLEIIRHSANRGKGAALRSGIAAATGDYILIQDADLEYDPAEYHLLLEPVLKGGADVVYGSRFMGSQPHRVLYFWHRLGNWLLTGLSNTLTGLNLTDMETCYKLFRADVLKSLSLKEDGFGFEPEVTAKISKIPGIKVYEVGISYYGRTFEEGKKIRMKDGFRAIWCIIKYNLFSRKPPHARLP